MALFALGSTRISAHRGSERRAKQAQMDPDFVTKGLSPRMLWSALARAEADTSGRERNQKIFATLLKALSKDVAGIEEIQL